MIDYLTGYLVAILTNTGIELPGGRRTELAVQVGMGILALAGLIISAMTVYNSVKSRGTRASMAETEHQLTDNNGGSIRQLISQGFRRTDQRLDELVAKNAILEGRIADVNKSVQEVRRELGMSTSHD